MCGEERWKELVEAVLSREIDPWSAADQMIAPVAATPSDAP